MKLSTYLPIFILLIFSNNSFSKINVVTTVPDLKWLMEEIGGEKVNVQSLLNGTEDVHFIEAFPSFIFKVNKADIFCQVGMEMEIGWVPKILQKSANPKIQLGKKGNCNASTTVKALNVPKGNINRSMGDVHAFGNPHYLLGPDSIIQAADSLKNVLINYDISNSELYEKNYKDLKIKILKVKKEVQVVLKRIQNEKFIEYHSEFQYFFNNYNLNSIGSIEETPGVPPSAIRLMNIAKKAKTEKVHRAVAAQRSPKKIMQKFSDVSGVKHLFLPIGIQTNERFNSFRKVQFYIAQKLIE